jgi:guanylate kinase
MNKVIIFCAPSGSGKTTIVKHLLNVNKQLAFSVSACTRAQRLNEVNGKDYYFLSHEEFKNKLVHGDFLEYEEVYGNNFYGTLKSEIDQIWDEGKVVIFDVDVEGGLNLKKYFKDKALAIFVKPPSVEILAQRLKERSTETEETLQVRIGKAVLELAYEGKFETVLVNENLAEALLKAEQLVVNFIEN